jgi:hypothetical protein
VNLTQSAQIAPDIYILTLTISTEADKEVKALSLQSVSVSAPQPTKDLQTITVFMRLSLVCK